MIRNHVLKSLSITLLVISFACSKAFAEEVNKTNPNRPIEDKWALVIGIDKFKDSRIPTLRYSAKDAKDFAEFLATKGNFARDHIKLLLNENATQQSIEESLGDTWLPRRAMSNDLVVIYVSTHGSPKEIDVGKDNWLIAHNTNIDKLFSTGIQLKTLASTVKNRTGCDRVVLILDACNSGAAETGGGKGLSRSQNFDLSSIVGEGEIVISSSESNQRSWESKRYKNGVFTRKLIELLSVTQNKMPLSKVFSELKSVVEQEVRFDRKVTQTPVYKSKWKGSDLILTSKPVKPRQVKQPKLASHSIPNTETQSETPQPTRRETVQKIASISTDQRSLAGKVEHRQNLKEKQLAFYTVTAPKSYTIKMSKAYGVVTQEDYKAISTFPSTLAHAIDVELKSKLANQYVSNLSMFKIREKNKASGKDTFKQLCKKSNAKYVANIAISKFYFKGQVSWSNIYDIRCLVSIYNGSTGNLLKQFEKRYKKQPWLGDSTGAWTDYVNAKVVPKYARELAKSILKAL